MYLFSLYLGFGVENSNKEQRKIKHVLAETELGGSEGPYAWPPFGFEIFSYLLLKFHVLNVGELSD